MGGWPSTLSVVDPHTATSVVYSVDQFGKGNHRTDEIKKYKTHSILY